ncbi:MAG: glycosyltransferase family 4 protein [Saprospiraceae bacterium]|nr:glycosyltransferase family 4 protein [Saprospiraceae bacterium]
MIAYFVTDYFWPGIGGLENSICYLATSLQTRVPVEILTTAPGKEMLPGSSLKIKRFDPCTGDAYREMAAYIQTRPLPAALCFMGFSDRWTEEHLQFIDHARRSITDLIAFKIPSLHEFSQYIDCEQRLRHFRSVKYALCLNSEIRRELKEHGVEGEKLVELTNGVPTSHFTPVSKRRKAELRQQFEIDDKPTFIFPGRFAGRKKVGLLIEAFSRVESANLILLGYPDDRFDQEAAVTLPKDHRRIRILGPTFDVRPYLQAADVFVSASSAEGMPNALLEAFSCGLPALVSDIAGHREVVDAGSNGRFFRTDDPDDLIEGIRWFAGNQHLYPGLSERAREKAVEHFDIERVADLYAKLLIN